MKAQTGSLPLVTVKFVILPRPFLHCFALEVWRVARKRKQANSILHAGHSHAEFVCAIHVNVLQVAEKHSTPLCKLQPAWWLQERKKYLSISHCWANQRTVRKVLLALGLLQLTTVSKSSRWNCMCEAMYFSLVKLWPWARAPFKRNRWSRSTKYWLSIFRIAARTTLLLDNNWSSSTNQPAGDNSRISTELAKNARKYSISTERSGELGESKLPIGKTSLRREKKNGLVEQYKKKLS